MAPDIKRAIKITDYLIAAHIKNASGMEELVKNWKTDSRGLGLEIASVHRDVATCLEEIKSCLIVIPKKRRKIESIKSK